jgi:transcriptional regulator of acetoin/glycerol metabolism
MAPTVVTGGEHFFLNTGTLSCAAAPIRNGCGRLAGVLDLTIEGRGFGFDAAALVGLYATLIENELLLARSRAAAVLRFQVCPTLLDGSMQALAGIDDRGRLAWSNGVAQRLLGLAAGHGVDAQPLLGLTLGELLRHAGQPPRPLPLPNGLTVWAQVAAAPRSAAPAEPVPVSSEATAMPDAVRGAVAGPATGAPPDAERCGATAHPDAVPTLDQHTRQTIRRVVDECGGNLSAAARRLGVSRGLLYRRLRG